MSDPDAKPCGHFLRAECNCADDEAKELRAALSASEARAKELERSADALQRAHANTLAASVKASARAAAAEARAKELEREREAYKRAKAENDERFMRERDEARAERDEARRALRECAEVLETHGLENSEAYQLARALSGSGAEEGRAARASHPGEER
jgi:hypothetical protein